MASTFTDNLRLTKQGDNDNPNSWGEVLNEVIELIEEAICEIAEIDCTGSIDVDIAGDTEDGETDDARHAILKLTGTLGANINLTVPTVEKIYVVWGAQTGGNVVVKPTGGTGVTIEPGDVKIIFTDGVNAVTAAAETDISTLLVKSNNLSDLTNAATARTNLGLGSAATQTTTQILQAIYPVGSLYFNAEVSTNPNSLLGFGTWTAYAAGRVLVGVGTGTDSNGTQQAFTLNGTTGEYTHVLTEAEMPSHRHNTGHGFSTGHDTAIYGTTSSGTPGQAGDRITSTSGTPNLQALTSLTGSGTAHNTVQPSIGVYIWRRTA